MKYLLLLLVAAGCSTNTSDLTLKPDPKKKCIIMDVIWKNGRQDKIWWRCEK